MKHKEQILNLYKAPFSHHYGYINDADGKVVSDDSGEDFVGIARVRGWGGLISSPDTRENAEDIQDEIGDIIAEALTEYWERNKT